MWNGKAELIELNAWWIEERSWFLRKKKRWYFDHFRRREDESFLTALQFEITSNGVTQRGWIPLRVNVRAADVIQSEGGLAVVWDDGIQSELLYRNIQSAFWSSLSGNGHEESDMEEALRNLSSPNNCVQPTCEDARG
jgi:hypothetical protein